MLLPHYFYCGNTALFLPLPRGYRTFFLPPPRYYCEIFPIYRGITSVNAELLLSPLPCHSLDRIPASNCWLNNTPSVVCLALNYDYCMEDKAVTVDEMILPGMTTLTHWVTFTSLCKICSGQSEKTLDKGDLYYSRTHAVVKYVMARLLYFTLLFGILFFKCMLKTLHCIWLLFCIAYHIHNLSLIPCLCLAVHWSVITCCWWVNVCDLQVTHSVSYTGCLSNMHVAMTTRKTADRKPVTRWWAQRNMSARH